MFLDLFASPSLKNIYLQITVNFVISIFKNLRKNYIDRFKVIFMASMITYFPFLKDNDFKGRGYHDLKTGLLIPILKLNYSKATRDLSIIFKIAIHF